MALQDTFSKTFSNLPSQSSGGMFDFAKPKKEDKEEMVSTGNFNGPIQPVMQGPVQPTPVVPKIEQKPIAVDTLGSPQASLAKAQAMLDSFSQKSTGAADRAKGIAGQPDQEVLAPQVTPEPQSTSDKMKALLEGKIDGTSKTATADARAAKEEQLQLQAKAAESNAVLNEIRTARLDYEDAIEEIEKNKSGSFGPTALNSRKNKLTTEYNRNAARQSIRYDVLQGRTTEAQNTLDTYMKDLATDEANEIKTWQLLMDLEQNDMTESEKLQATQAFQEKQSQAAFQNSKDLAQFNSQLRVSEMTIGAGIEDAAKAIEEKQIAEGEKTQVLSNLSLINDILGSEQLGQVVGLKNPFTYWTPGSNEQLVKNQLRQLNASLSLDARQKLKGSGTISDFEARTLGNSVSALGGNLSNEATVEQLTTLRGVFKNAAGLPATVELRDPRTGNSQVVDATRDGINDALSDGLEVTYK